MSKIKSVSQFEDNIWGEATPIGADASNIDVEMSDSSTKDLQTVLGDIPSAAAPIQSQINTKVTASGGNIGNTTVSSGIQNFDSSSSETSTELLDTSVRVTNATEVTSSMWTKFNRFRKRVDNKFKDVFLSSVEDVASPSDYKTYSQSALNDYFANVVGYASASDLPDATSTIAQQLSTLNNKIYNVTHENYSSYTVPYGTWSDVTLYKSTYITNSTWNDGSASYPHGISDIKLVWKYEAMFWSSDWTQVYMIPYLNIVGGTTRFFTIEYVNKTSYYYVSNGGQWAGFHFMLVIYHTKTTDS